ncbi:hypothetical protein GT037_008905 [Alternaria burnsii]|uniref:EthD domain-containing protein n=1 Tax=Alternaria burnsii TaxID=1187904 RepID=A0A8H7EEI1_9PLEO|nr:uncharacterized protein GT037_008905 [Alternaria burnsii]KAF7672954.1 hypothetical protein GT037_008905 [Alternaria burnsii]RYN99648.1 hypothetical protein AA0120_g2011 [Alternaria tenuissima]RYO53807.1 hypothetical protein AA0116_g10211 [Alternaria tenuissima]CAI9633367.1 unnamed protein product [Alternaria burnsii]
MSTEELVRVTVLANRNPKLSETEFNDHWANKHGPLITSWLQRHGIVKYVQYHTTSKHKALLKLPTLSYDGMADFWVRNFEDFQKAYEDPFYLDVVKKDEEYLFDLESLRVTAGVEYYVIEDGKVMQEHARKI